VDFLGLQKKISLVKIYNYQFVTVEI